MSEELVRLHRDELPHICVVLPTQRQVLYLQALLAQKLEAFRPPLVLTLDPFIAELARHDHYQLPEQAPEILQELLLAALIREKSYKHLQLGHEHEIKQFFNDIAEYGLDGDAFTRLKAVMQQDVYRSEEHLGSLLQRIEELEDLHSAFFQLLRERHYSSPALAQAETGRFLAAKFQEQVSHPWRWLYFACFTTMKEYYRPFFQALQKHERVSLWFSQAPQLMGGVNPLAELTGPRVPKPSHEETPHTERSLAIYQRETVLDEIAGAYEIARQHIAGGCPPSQIAIVLTSEARYGKLARTLAGTLEVQANLAISTPVSQTPLGAWLCTLMDWFSQENNWVCLLAFMTHPITETWLRRQDLLPQAKNLSASLTLALSRSVASASEQSCHSLSRHAEDPVVEQALRAVQEVLAPLFRVVTLPGTKSPLHQWVGALEQVFTSFGLFDQVFGEDAGIAQSSVTVLSELLESLTLACSFRDPWLSRREFWRLVKDKMMGLETRSIGFPFKGVQVLNLIEARYIPFQVVIVLGCVEGAFPKALPKDYLIDDWLKEQIGLPGWQYVEALEDTTFQLLRARIPHLVLSFPRFLGGAVTVRSRFIEKVISEEKTPVQGGGVQGRERPLPMERPLPTELPGHFQGSRKALLQEMSATKLEELLHCPYRFLLSQLGVQSVSIHGLNKIHAAKEEGRWMHSILQAFFTGYALGKRWTSELPERVLCAEWEAFAVERLSFLTRAMGGSQLLRTPLYQHLLHFAWPRFARHLRGFFDRSPDGHFFEKSSISRCEWSLGLQGGASGALVQLEEFQFYVKGVLDRVDLARSHYVLTDYKRKRVPNQKEVLAGLSPQLALYALALSLLAETGERLRLEQAVLGYWSILEGKWEPRAAGEEGQKWALARGLSSAKLPCTTEVAENLRAVWLQRARALLQDGEAFAPEPGKACTYCPYEGVCRRDDPQQRAAFARRGGYG